MLDFTAINYNFEYINKGFLAVAAKRKQLSLSDFFNSEPMPVCDGFGVVRFVKWRQQRHPRLACHPKYQCLADKNHLHLDSLRSWAIICVRNFYGEQRPKVHACLEYMCALTMASVAHFNSKNSLRRKKLLLLGGQCKHTLHNAGSVLSI